MKCSMFMVTFPKHPGKDTQVKTLQLSQISSQTTLIDSSASLALQGSTNELADAAQFDLTEPTDVKGDTAGNLSNENADSGIEMRNVKSAPEGLNPEGSPPSSNQSTTQKSPEIDQENLLEGVKDADFAKEIKRLCKKYKVSKCTWLQGLNGTDITAMFVAESGLVEEEILEGLIDHGIGNIAGTSLSISPVTVYVAGEKEKLPKDKSYGVLSNVSQVSGKKPEEQADTSERHVQIDVATDDSESSLSDESEDEEQDGFIKSIPSRIIVRPVIDGLKRNAEFTFDYLMFIIIASTISTIGLIENSSVILVASMLISPLMGPILAGTFGAAIQDKELTRLGLRIEAIGLFLCVLTGFLAGLPVVYSIKYLPWITSWPSVEMYARGYPQNLIIGAIIALFSGAGVALSVLGENSGSLVGVAISASLLPPAVNTGLLWAVSFAEATYSASDQIAIPANMTKTSTALPNMALCTSRTFQSYQHRYACDSSQEAFILGAISFCLTLINIILIIIGSIIVLKIKQVSPRASCNSERAFWMTHIGVHSNYQKTIKSKTKDHQEFMKLKEHVRSIVKQTELDSTSKTIQLRYPSASVGIEETMDKLIHEGYYRTCPNKAKSPTSPNTELRSLFSRQKSATAKLETDECSRKKKGRFTVEKQKEV